MLEGGCLGRGLFVFSHSRPRKPQSYEMKFWKQPPIYTVNSSISRNHKNHKNRSLENNPWAKQAPFGAPNLNLFLPHYNLNVTSAPPRIFNHCLETTIYRAILFLTSGGLLTPVNLESTGWGTEQVKTGQVKSDNLSGHFSWALPWTPLRKRREHTTVRAFIYLSLGHVFISLSSLYCRDCRVTNRFGMRVRTN